MNVRQFTLSLVLLCLFQAYSSFAWDKAQAGARSQSLGGVSASLSGHWSVFGNQAGLAGINTPSAGLAYESMYLLRELSVKSAQVIVPTNRLVLGFSVHQTGQHAIRYNNLSFSAARAFSPQWSAGVQFGYFSAYFPENDRSPGAPTVSAGVLYSPSAQVAFGFHMHNPYPTSINTYSSQYHLPSVFRIGSSFRVSESLTWVAELEKDTRYAISWKTGLEYSVLEQLFFRGGFAVKPYLLTFGLGYIFRNLSFDMASVYHQQLGLTPSVSLSYAF